MMEAKGGLKRGGESIETICASCGQLTIFPIVNNLCKYDYRSDYASEFLTFCSKSKNRFPNNKISVLKINRKKD